MIQYKIAINLSNWFTIFPFYHITILDPAFFLQYILNVFILLGFKSLLSFMDDSLLPCLSCVFILSKIIQIAIWMILIWITIQKMQYLHEHSLFIMTKRLLCAFIVQSLFDGPDRNPPNIWINIVQIAIQIVCLHRTKFCGPDRTRSR